MSPPSATANSRYKRDRSEIVGGKPDSPTPLGLLLSLGLPVLLLNATFVIMQITDAWMLGKLGSTELAAVTMPSMAIFVIVSFGYGLLASVTTTASHSYGKKNYVRCGQLAWLGILVAAVAGLASLVLWPLGSAFILLPGAEPVLANYESQYFQVSLIALTPVLVINAIANFYFAIRRTGIVLAAACFGMGLNILFSYGLIFGKLGMPECGMRGAAWGTVIASVIQCLFIAAFFLWRTEARYRSLSPPRSLDGIRKLLSIGLPGGSQAAVDVLSWGVLLSILVGSFGEADLAAAAVLVRCMQITFLPSEGIATIIVTLVGSSLGRGRPVHALVYTRLAFRIIAIYMTTCGILFYLFRRPLMEAFTDSPEVISIGMSAMIFIAAAQFFDAMNLTYLHALQGGGDTRWPWLANVILSTTILLGGGLFVIFAIPGAGSEAIWFLVLVYIAAQGICFWLRWKTGRWRSTNLEA
jgi:MATE family multidrug resistance protein